jgi:hypothetical protein
MSLAFKENGLGVEETVNIAGTKPFVTVVFS